MNGGRDIEPMAPEARTGDPPLGAQAGNTHSPPGRGPHLRRYFGFTLALAALFYLGVLVHQNLDEFLAGIDALSLLQVLGAVVAAVAMLALKAAYHVMLCQRLSGKSALAAEVLPAYCTAQVVRYLPGKIWGIVYQSGKLAKSVGQREVVAANAIQTVTTNLLGSAVIVSSLAAFHTGQPIFLVGILIGIVMVEMLHRTPSIEAWLLRLAYKVGRRSSREIPSIPPMHMRGTAILVLEWVAYFLMWHLIAAGSSGTGGAALFGIWYAAASLIAVLAIAVPGGLAVREAIFVGIASSMGAHAATLVALAAVARLVLTAGELLCIPLASIYSRFIRRAGA